MTLTTDGSGSPIRHLAVYSENRIFRDQVGTQKELCQHISKNENCEKHGGLVVEHQTPGPEALKKNSCSTQLRLKFILLMNVKMPTIVSRINY